MIDSAPITPKQAVFIVVKGMAMGAADVVPGVSGGTIAFITGIYERLIQAVSRFDTRFVRCIFSGQWAAAARHIDVLFLLLLFAGIGVSVFSLAHLISYLLETHALLVWSFFIGLVLASSLVLLRNIDSWGVLPLLLLAVGITAALAVNVLRPMVVEPSLFYVFICGMIAICAMLLPGISGSFLLLVLGVYGFVLEAVKSFDLIVLMVFMSGAGIGILGFAKILAYAMAHARTQVFALLTGFLLGSVALIWPWKLVTETLSSNITPAAYAAHYGVSAQLWPCLGLMVAGFLLVFLVEQLTIE